ncbi:MAG: putative terminase large subunit [Prokaryotic dsDNA virus sp.]|nr:MAG: putative terminase large subunit [Prokaryotic dsDNA virus sp.]
MKLLSLKGTVVLKKNLDASTRIVVNQGGTRSSKTYSLAQLIILKALQTKGKVYTICRKTLPALKGTAYRDFFSILESHNLYNPENHNKSELTYKLNGNEIEFISVDMPQKIRGRKRNILWLNEANEFDFESWVQLSLRTTENIYLDFNPSDPYSWIYDNVINREDCTFIKSTYLDNPFLPEETIKEIERLRDLDSNYWKIYGLGDMAQPTETIFRQFEICNNVPEQAQLIAMGMDFGYSNDPTALVEVFKLNDNLYLNEVLYSKGLTNQDIAAELRKHSITRQIEIIGDSAEPKSIEEINRLGFNVKPAKKGADSINMGIDILRRYKIHITKSSTNTINEFKFYKWLVDKNGKVINKPATNQADHIIDSVRYVALNKLTTNYSGKYYIL